MSQKYLKITRLFISGWLLALLLIATQSSAAQANGGTIIFVDNVGAFNVIVTRSPSPPTPNVSLHMSMLITKANNPQKVTDATVIVSPDMPGMAMGGVVPTRAYRGQTENTYDVDFPVNMEGQWVFQIQINSPQFGVSDFTVKDKIEKPDAPWIIIIGILVGLPILGGLTWFFLFRKSGMDDDEDEEKAETNTQKT